jgi:predicted Na+-dependent transporter
MARCSDDLFCFSSGNVALSVLMTAASTLAAVVSKLVLLSLPVYFFFFLGGGGLIYGWSHLYATLYK